LYRHFNADLEQKNQLKPKKMPRGGYREGAGRKKEYNEPVKKILLGLPQSVLRRLDEYATEHDLSRPKTVAQLLSLAEAAAPSPPPELQPQQADTSKMLSELKNLKQQLTGKPES